MIQTYYNILIGYMTISIKQSVLMEMPYLENEVKMLMDLRSEVIL